VLLADLEGQALSCWGAMAREAKPQIFSQHIKILATCHQSYGIKGQKIVPIGD